MHIYGLKECSRKSGGDYDQEIESEDDNECETYDSEDEKMIVSSEDEADESFPEFDEHVNLVAPEFVLGMLFSNGEVLRYAVRTHAIIERRPITRTPNMGCKIQFKCVAPCNWKLYAAKLENSDTYQIRTLFQKHTCYPVFQQAQISANWIAKMYENEIRMNPKWGCEAFQKKVVNDLGCQVKYSMCHRAKEIALKVINGTHEESYAQLWNYGNEVKRVMPDSTLTIELEDKEPNQDRGRFKRLYVCLGPVKKGFMAGCRPIIGMDGCHLKGPYGGQLLAAVGMDPNDGIYPVSLAVVDAENTENWIWFITQLKDDLNICNDSAWTFISDKQKGLINALEVLCPNAEHRFCVMHLYKNMWMNHKGIGLRKLLWQAARSTTNYHFDKNMAAMLKMNKKCHDWLIEKPKAQWSRSDFRIVCKSDLFVNNYCEVFNATIRKHRHLPIVSLLREIHKDIMCRIQKRKSGMLVKTGKFCSNAMEKLNKAIVKSVGCHVTWSGGPRFSVTTSAGGYEIVVDLFSKTCACRKWQLTGIPCFHAVACMNSRGMNLEDGIHICYSSEMFKKVYNFIVEPINGPEEWNKTNYTPPLPPNVKVPAGRPKLKRKKKNDIPPDATNLKRQNTSLKCSFCKTLGHNCRSCPTKKNAAATEDIIQSHNATGNKDNESDAHQFENATTNQFQNTIVSEFIPGASHPSPEIHESQGGIFQQPQNTNKDNVCGVAPKTWQNQKMTVTTRAEILKARSIREKEQIWRYQE